MAIPNPNPNIKDGVKADNTTWSSNKIAAAISSAAELPVVTSEDKGKALIVDNNGDWGASAIPSQLPDIPTTESPHMIGSTIVAGGSSWIAKPTSLMIALDISKSGDVYTYSTQNRSSKNSDIIDIIGAMVNKPFSFMFDITLYFQGRFTPLGDDITATTKPTKIKCSNVIATSSTTFDLYFPFALNNSGTVRTGYFIVGINSSDDTKTVTFIETTQLPSIVLTDTLEAGETSLTFTDASITTGSNIRILTSAFGVAPTAVSASTGSLTLTFTAQISDLDVKVVIY